MLKKIFRYLGLVLGALTCLPIFTATWNYVVTNGDKSEVLESYNLFDKFGEVAKKALGDKFAPFWFTLFQTLVVVMVVLAVVMLVVYILNDLGVLKAQKLEKLLSVVMVVLGILALVVVLIATVANKVEVKLISTTVYGIGGAVMAWLAPVFAVVGGALACYGANDKAKKKKRK